MSTVHSSIDEHPDLLALRAGYERAAKSVGAYVAFGLTLLTGLYVAASPWIVDFSPMARFGAMSRLAWSDLIAGIAVAVLAYGFATALDRTHGLSWTVPVIGAWTILSPWVLSGLTPVTPGVAWSQAVAGGVMTCLGLAATYFGMRTRVGTPKHTHEVREVPEAR